ncbi:MAG: PAS domain-containing sensor histidine kinase [Gemmatimonadetes bacterium]|nr:PAS domain-containing sensor histidine kinase [Gemmatimonadota bacterium]
MKSLLTVATKTDFGRPLTVSQPNDNRAAPLRDYRAVFEASPDAILFLDAKGVIRDLNPRALSMFGWSREEMEGSPVEMLIPASSRALHEQHRSRYAEAPSPRQMGLELDVHALRKDGTTFPVEVSLSPGEEPGPEQVVCTIRDIDGWRRMRWLSRMTLVGAENERKRISRELHDDLLQFLVAFKVRGKLLVDRVDQEEREEAWAVIADEITNAVRGVKHMIRGLRPPNLEEQGLLSAFATLFRDTRKVHGLTIHAAVTVDWASDEMDPMTVVALYRIVQEAVTNAATHAGVNEASVTIRTGDGVLVAEIRDEGCGFDPPGPGAEPDSGGIGLSSMRERAELVGGSLAVRSSPERGTTVRATVPMVSPEGER